MAQEEMKIMIWQKNNYKTLDYLSSISSFLLLCSYDTPHLVNPTIINIRFKIQRSIPLSSYARISKKLSLALLDNGTLYFKFNLYD